MNGLSSDVIGDIRKAATQIRKSTRLDPRSIDVGPATVEELLTGKSVPQRIDELEASDGNSLFGIPVNVDLTLPRDSFRIDGKVYSLKKTVEVTFVRREDLRTAESVTRPYVFTPTQTSSSGPMYSHVQDRMREAMQRRIYEAILFGTVRKPDAFVKISDI